MRIVIATDTIPAPSCGKKDRRFACEYPVDNRAGDKILLRENLPAPAGIA